jgi:hypothetical protein
MESLAAIAFNRLEIGAKFTWYRVEGDFDSMAKTKVGEKKFTTQCGVKCDQYNIIETVYIKDKPMTDKEQALKRIEAAEERAAEAVEEIKQAKAMLNKPDRIKVPDCIDLYTWNGNKFSILFNDKQQRLGECEGKYHVQVHGTAYDPEKDLYLEPCKREDIKPGDVAYMQDIKNPDFSGKLNYHCILDEEDYAYASGLNIVVSGCTYNYCWKVVK